MREGRIIADGSPGEIKEQAGADSIDAAFLAIVRRDAA
jgi:ABC-2 type transport system ATP-binding protein